MVNLYEIARGAQGGAWFDAMARQFGMDPAQTQRAVDALLPAFSIAFQRNALRPGDFANLLGLLGSGSFAPFYDAAASAPPRPAAESLLSQLFGSKQAAEAVAAQAAAMTGIGTQVLQQMMPALAATLVGGMFRYATAEGYADVLRQWSDALKAAQPRPAPNPQDPWSAWVNAVSSMMGAPQKPSPPPPHPMAQWSDTMAAFLGSAVKPPPPPPSKPDPFAAVLQMFETGREAQAKYVANLRNILLGDEPPKGGDETQKSKPAP